MNKDIDNVLLFVNLWPQRHKIRMWFWIGHISESLRVWVVWTQRVSTKRQPQSAQAGLRASKHDSREVCHNCGPKWFMTMVTEPALRTTLKLHLSDSAKKMPKLWFWSCLRCQTACCCHSTLGAHQANNQDHSSLRSQKCSKLKFNNLLQRNVKWQAHNMEKPEVTHTAFKGATHIFHCCSCTPAQV